MSEVTKKIMHLTMELERLEEGLQLLKTKPAAVIVQAGAFETSISPNEYPFVHAGVERALREYADTLRRDIRNLGLSLSPVALAREPRES